LLKLFLTAQRPISIFDIKKFDFMNEFNESSIYRNLTRFEELDIIQAVPSSHDYQLFELKNPEHHHHHIVCTSCEEVRCLSGCGLDKAMKKMATNAGFILKGHSLELFGLCAKCQ